MITGNNKPAIPNFSGTEVRHWATEDTEPAVFYAYLAYLRKLMLWLETEGKQLLEREAPWSEEEFSSVCKRMGVLTYDIQEFAPFVFLLRSILKKGVASLRVLAETDAIPQEQADQYLRAVTFYMEAGAPCGMSEVDEYASECTAAMLDSLVPVAQHFKDEHMLSRIAGCRIRGWARELPCQLYVAKFKNWQVEPTYTKKVLIVEDSQGYYSRYKSDLEDWPEVQMILATYTGQALRLFSQNTGVDAIIMDACLGNTDTPDTMPVVAKIREAGYKGPIVANSNSSTNNKLLLEAGCDKEFYGDKIEMVGQLATLLGLPKVTTRR